MQAHSDAAQVLRAHDAPLLLTCEHASNAVPAPLAAGPEDRRWLESHWGWDIGIEPATRAILDRLGGAAVFARFSRLVCDANRRPDADSLILTHIDGAPLSFNQHLDAAERDRRLETLHGAYHDAIHAEAARLASLDPLLLSMHSFTPSLRGETRPMEVGVLFDDWEPQAHALADRIRAQGFVTALNAPYSGRGGLIYAIRRHGLAHRRVYLELEIRQDLLSDDASARRVGERLADALEGWEWRATP